MSPDTDRPSPRSGGPREAWNEPRRRPSLEQLRNCRDEYPVFVALFVLTAALLVAWPVVDVYLRAVGVAIPYRLADFSVYADAVHRWLDGGPIYVRNEDGGFHGGYLYPPVVILLFAPFTVLAPGSGAFLFEVVSVCLLWAGLLAVVRALGYELRRWQRLALFPATFGFQPALRDFKWGQVSTLLAALLCFAFYAQERGVQASTDRFVGYASGALTTLGSAVKLFVAPSGAHLLRDRSRFVGAIATAGALGVLSLALFGVEAHLAYAEVLLWGKGWGARPPYVWDATAAYYPLYVLGDLETPARVLGLLGVIALTLVARSDGSATVRRATFALGVASVPLFAPRADVHDLVVVLLPAVVLLAVEFEVDGVPSLPVLAVLLVHLHRYVVEVAVRPEPWVPFAGVVGDHAAWFQPATWGTLLLVGLAAYRVAVHGAIRSSRLRAK